MYMLDNFYSVCILILVIMFLSTTSVRFYNNLNFTSRTRLHLKHTAWSHALPCFIKVQTPELAAQGTNS